MEKKCLRTRVGYIYLITNTQTKKEYVGQTLNCPFKRFKRHLSDALSNRKGSTCLLANALRKYRRNNFVIEILKVCSVEMLDWMENYYVALYGTYGGGYNLTKGGKGSRGFKHTDESRAKINNRYYPPVTGRKLSQITCERISLSKRGKNLGLPKSELFLKKVRKPVSQFDENDKLINQWDSVLSASKTLGLNHSGISRCARGLTAKYKNYKWTFVLNEEEFDG